MEARQGGSEEGREKRRNGRTKRRTEGGRGEGEGREGGREGGIQNRVRPYFRDVQDSLSWRLGSFFCFVLLDINDHEESVVFRFVENHLKFAIKVVLQCKYNCCIKKHISP